MDEPLNDTPRATSSRLGRLFTWLSGANTAVLADAPGERLKMQGLGGIVLMTAAMAGTSAMFALHMALNVAWYAFIPLGVLWGLAIMNLDRWLISASPRREKAWQSFMMVLPRLLLAIIIGGVVSTPLVLRLFQSEIETQLDITHRIKQSDYEESLRADERFTQIPTLQREVDHLQRTVDAGRNGDPSELDPTVQRLRRERAVIQAQYDQAVKDVLCEDDGTCGTGVIGKGDAYYLKVARRDELKRQLVAKDREITATKQRVNAQASVSQTNALRTAESTLATKKGQLARLQDQRRLAEDTYAASIKNDRGLLARLEALDTLTHSNPTLRFAYVSLLIFLAAIEVLPVFMKFLMSIGPPSLYETLLEEREKGDRSIARTRIQEEVNRRTRDETTRSRTHESLNERRWEHWREGKIRDMDEDAKRDERMSAHRGGGDDWMMEF